MKNEEQIGFRIKEIGRLIDKSIYQKGVLHAGADSVTSMNSWMIGYLYHRRNQEVFQKDMERDFHLAKSSVTSILQHLESCGYIKRVSVERDARLKKIELTQEGERFHHSVEDGIREMETKISKGLSAQEKTLLMDVLHKISVNLENEIMYDKEQIKKFGNQTTQEAERTCRL